MLTTKQNFRSILHRILNRSSTEVERTNRQTDEINVEGDNKSAVIPDREVFQLIEVVPGLKQAIRETRVIDITVAGAMVPNEADGISNVVTTILDPDHPHDGIAALPVKQHYIMLRGVLQLVRDYRGTIASAFAHLRVGGWLIVTVPHQFLAERKFRLPSRYGTRAMRLYTPATLIGEIEEALDPTEYRLRLLCDDDEGYDYAADISRLAEGHQRIVLAVQRIKRPSWADRLTDSDEPITHRDADTHVLHKDVLPTATTIIAPATAAIKTILVVKLDHRGDYLMAAPAITELRRLYPDATITFVCGSWNVETARSSSWFDEVIPFNFFAEDASLQKEPDRARMTELFAKSMSGRKFDLAIDMRAFDDTRELLRRINARFKAGFDRWNNFPWLDITLTLPLPTIDGRAEQHEWSAGDFHTRLPISSREIIIPATRLFRKPRIAVYGPYKTLTAGRYNLRLNLRSAARQKIFVDVVCSEARKKLFVGHVAVGPESCEAIEFSTFDTAHDIEVRINAPRWTGQALSFQGASLVKEGAIVGLHQRESMYLLVQLIAIRLTAPYTRESAMETA